MKTWMPVLDTDQRTRVADALGRVLLAEPEVRIAYLFGSFATGSFFADIDVGVLFDSGAARDFRLHARIADRLEAACGVGAPVDLRVLNDAPISFVGPIVQRGRLLFARDAGERLDYETRVLSMWFDFLPTWRENAMALYQRVATYGR